MTHPSNPPSATETGRRSDVEPDAIATSAELHLGLASETLQVVEESLHVSKREVLERTVRVSTRTESVETVAEVALDRTLVDVTRVPMGRIVEVAPSVRTEGDVTIVPVVEERFVVVKQLYLSEELHIRRRVETEVSQIPVVLRRQTAVVEHLDAQGRVQPAVTAGDD